MDRHSARHVRPFRACGYELKAGRVDLDYLARYTTAYQLVVDEQGAADDGLFVRDGKGRVCGWDNRANAPADALDASICGSTPRNRISRPRWARACVIAVRMSVSSSFSSTISPDTACDIDHRREIQMFDRCPDRDGRIGRRLFLA